MTLSIVSNLGAASVGFSYSACSFLHIITQEFPFFFNDQPVSQELLRFADLLQREGIRDDIMIFEKGPWLFKTLGTNYPKISKAAIFVLNGIKETDHDAYDFNLILAFYHIKNHSNVLEHLAGIIANVALYTFVFYMTSNEWAASSISLVAMYVLNRYQNHQTKKKIWDFVVKNASLRHLDGGMRLLKCLRSLYKPEKYAQGIKGSKIIKIEEEMDRRIKKNPQEANSLLQMEEQKKRARLKTSDICRSCQAFSWTMNLLTNISGPSFPLQIKPSEGSARNGSENKEQLVSVPKDGPDHFLNALYQQDFIDEKGWIKKPANLPEIPLLNPASLERLNWILDQMLELKAFDQTKNLPFKEALKN